MNEAADNQSAAVAMPFITGLTSPPGNIKLTCGFGPDHTAMAV